MSSLTEIPLWGRIPEPARRAAEPPTAEVGGEWEPSLIPEPDTTVDWSVVIRLRRAASEEIAAQLAAYSGRGRRQLTDADKRMLGRSVVRTIVRHHAEQLSASGDELWSLEREAAYADALESAIFGYGRLQPLFEFPDAENIEVNGCDHVVVQYPSGRRRTLPPVAESDAELVEAIRFLGESATPARPFDDAHPTMTLALGDRFRLHAIGFGLAARPSVTIRQHTLTDVTLQQLSDGGMFPAEVAELLTAAVRARTSMVVAGDQGAGKTTLLRALIAAIPESERFGTVETDYELLTHLQPHRRNVVALQARIGMGETVDGRRLGEVTVADLIPEALRQNLARIVVGEVRGTEAGAMFEAMSSGAGALATTHSRSAASTMDRLASRVAQGGVVSVEEAYRQIAHNVGLLIHVQLVDDTWRGGRRRRFISQILHVTGAIEGDRPTTHLVYEAGTAGDSYRYSPDAALLEELAPFWEARP